LTTFVAATTTMVQALQIFFVRKLAKYTLYSKIGEDGQKPRSLGLRHPGLARTQHICLTERRDDASRLNTVDQCKDCRTQRGCTFQR